MCISERSARLVVTACCLVSLLVPMTDGCSRPAERRAALRDVVIVGQRSGDDCARDDDIEATTATPVVLHVVVRAEADGVERYYSTAGSVVLDGKSIQTAPWPRENGPMHVRWYSIKPGLRPYVNTDDYVAKIHYVERPLSGGWSLGVPKRCGTYRYRVQFSGGGALVSSPGRERATRENLLPGVRRVSIREDRGRGDNVDFMTMFFNVAYVYGNTESEADNFIGIDCQDLCIYGLNRTGWDISYDAYMDERYPSHIIFDGVIDVLGRAFDCTGRPTVVPIRRGDIIQFPAPHPNGHCGAVYADRSLLGKPNGRLDLFDDIVHTLKATQISKLGWLVWPRAVIRFSRDTTAGKGLPRCPIRVLRFERKA